MKTSHLCSTVQQVLCKKIEVFARIGKDTPEGTVIGSDGIALTDSDLDIVETNRRGSSVSLWNWRRIRWI